jgi:hypothetical protein
LVAILADDPELMALGTLSGVAPSKMAQGFNDPEHVFSFLDLNELSRIKGACERLGALTALIAAALDIYASAANAALSEASGAD